MSFAHPISRRRFLERLALGCAGALGLHALGLQLMQPDDAVTRLALRIVQVMGNAPAIWHPAPSTRSIPELLSTAFEPVALAHLLRLETTQLEHGLAAYIAADYQKGALVHHHGWWLARSEVAILELRVRLR